jgi:hypothetical protein
MKVCKIEGCGGKHCARGWCRIHYNRWERNGDPNCGDLRSKGGIRDHPMYGAWSGMVNRCTNPNHTSFARYGGIGITVCDRWRDFRNFLADMGERPAGKTLDRIDGMKGYEPGNCRWASATEQRRNITAGGDAATRRATSKSKREFWARKKAEGDLSFMLRGSRHVQAKLTEEIVAGVKAAIRGGKTQYRIAKELGVSAQMINDIAKGRTWKHVA